MKPGEAKQLIERTGQLQTTYLGSRTSTLGVEENVGIEDQYRRTHVLNIGATGGGKTQLMTHAALQDAYKDTGFAVINPKGGLIDELIEKLPEDRLNDIIYINPGKEPVPGINVLQPQINEDMTEAQVENQKEIIVSDLIDLFKRQSENWGDRFGRVLETLLRAHINLNIQKNSEKTLLHVFKTVVNDEALEELIDETQDPVVREELVRVREDLSSSQLEPLQRRLNDFVMNPTIRKVIAAKQSSFDIKDAIDNQRIILVEVQKGDVGGQVSRLVGSIIITKIWAAAQSRISQPEEQRDPFHLYVDELDNFAGEGSNFTTILSEAREYRLGCWLATQYLDQLPTRMQQAVTNNCRTKIALHPGDGENTASITRMFNNINQSQLKSLGNYRAVIQKPGQKQQQNAVIFDTYPPWEPENTRDINRVKRRQTPAKKTKQVELEVEQSLGNSANAGGDEHLEMLAAAKEELETRGFQVNLLYQDSGDEKPDGHVFLPDNDIAHLEAELSTLTKPAKVLENLRRGIKENREVFFVVKNGDAAKLENIISDPVNRRGSEHTDSNGGFSYYKDSDGQPVKDTEQLQNAEYRVLELDGDSLQEIEEPETDCPQIDDGFDEEELEDFCLYREEDGYCSELGQECVITTND
ncbi:type IV secretion system DNA-binding domain-containing protein [Halobaculum sp. WSA2]|uniref:Type IV secretion system DNA-binding domain-containing protein n=1 Tax=Halobaculum saliterrae TaxID=2073113 RepID=A0A6B0SV44_9EURY|nr:TraM recognition domain-containing protein [Halobaculum saliterrae]MXR40082.1 type IV secretion system DNA-binding domain-containing protein [Halobaculum saliterrae]